jgi:hypothetical protein
MGARRLGAHRCVTIGAHKEVVILKAEDKKICSRSWLASNLAHYPSPSEELDRSGSALWPGRVYNSFLMKSVAPAALDEVGAFSQMLGGNLSGTRRVLTTAIVMETGTGHYERAMAYGIVLLLVAFVVGLLT